MISTDRYVGTAVQAGFYLGIFVWGGGGECMYISPQVNKLFLAKKSQGRGELEVLRGKLRIWGGG